VTEIHDAGTAAGLAEHLKSRRRLPTVVVTAAAGQPEPYVDVADVAAAVRGLAEVYVLATGPATWAFSRGLPEGTQVYGGAARVYPVDLGWLRDPFRSPLRFAFGLADRALVTEAVISDALTMAHAAGATQAPAVKAALRPAEGTVLGVVGGRALVTLDQRTMFPAMIWPELLAANVPAERLFVKGMRVSGVYNPEQNRLDVAAMALSSAAALAGYTAGTTALARVTTVERGMCVVELFPGTPVTIAAADAVRGPEPTDLRTVLSVGEVLPVRVVAADSEAGFVVDFGQQPDEEPVDAPPLLGGGPPWLVPPPPPVFSDDIEEDVASLTDGPTATVSPEHEDDPQLAALRQERDLLLGELRRADTRVTKASRTMATLKTDLRNAKERAAGYEKELLEAQQRLTSRAVLGDETLFADPRAQLTFDVEVTWAYRTLPGEKVKWPLRTWQVGGHFLSSWAEVQGVDRAKVVDVIVDVLTGRVEQQPTRQLHQLRDGSGGNDRPVVRPDGATCWRVSLQHRTPSARRLHFWRLKDGSVELSSIRLHDNMTP
jgi:hypothetical protein